MNSSRFRAPRWRDPRVIIGIFLVVASLSGTWLVVRALADSVTVWSAKTVLVPGSTITEEHIEAVEVKLPNADHGYLDATVRSPVGNTVNAQVAVGDLIPAAAVTSPGDLSGRVVALSIYGSIPDSVASGSMVDVWAADIDEDEPQPRLLLERAPVLSVKREGGGFTAAADLMVEVYVTDEQIESVMYSQASEHRVTVVAMPGDAI